MSDDTASCCVASRSAVGDASEGSHAEETDVESSDGETSAESADERTRADTARMAMIPTGNFRMGTDDPGFPKDGEGPVREVDLDAYYIDKHAVTNAEFVQFVKDTGHTTEAERYGWSFVLENFLNDENERYAMDAVPSAPWWVAVEGACWLHPEGPESSISDRLDHPVVHVSWNDAVAYCEWAGKRLPTEAEWERAARGGLEGKRFPWGDELTPDGQHRCNIWQGDFPRCNTGEDGYLATAPVDEFEPNGHGLYNTAGNVWEWCADWFSPDHHIDGPRENPHGPSGGTKKVIRGGSYLCHRSYCNRYRVAARTSSTPDSSTGHTGFRCVLDV